MCRSIKKLRYPDRAPSDVELHEAALQFVRKVSGYRAPARKNTDAFNRAIAEVAVVTRRLFDELDAQAQSASRAKTS